LNQRYVERALKEFQSNATMVAKKILAGEFYGYLGRKAQEVRADRRRVDNLQRPVGQGHRAAGASIRRGGVSGISDVAVSEDESRSRDRSGIEPAAEPDKPVQVPSGNTPEAGGQTVKRLYKIPQVNNQISPVQKAGEPSINDKEVSQPAEQDSGIVEQVEDDNAPDKLSQSAKGAVEFLKDGRAIKAAIKYLRSDKQNFISEINSYLSKAVNRFSRK
jgi:hypothetical protein